MSGPGTSPSTLGIAVVNFRSASDTAMLVRSIVDRHRDCRVRVAIAIVDNSDERAQLESVVRFAKTNGIAATLIHGHGNVGYAAGNNLAVRWLMLSDADTIWVLNPDTRIIGGSLDAAVDLVRGGERAVGATARATPGDPACPDLGMLDLWTGRSGQPPADGEAGRGKLVYPAGSSLLVTSRAWMELNGFCEDFFLFFEEADLTVRSRRLGIPTLVIADLVTEHAGGTSTGATRNMRTKSLTTYFHASRSSMIFFRRHYRRRLPVAVTARLLYAGKALIASGPGAAGAVVRGVLAGLRA